MAETVGKPKGLTNSLSYYYSSPHLNFLIHWTREYNGRKNTKLCSCNASIDSVSGDLWLGQHVDIIPVDHEGEVIHRMSTALDGSVCVGLSPYVCCKYWSVKCLWVWCVMIDWMVHFLTVSTCYCCSCFLCFGADWVAVYTYTAVPADSNSCSCPQFADLSTTPCSCDINPCWVRGLQWGISLGIT